MNKKGFLATLTLATMLNFGVASATVNLNDMPEEELARTLASVLKKNPKIAYDAVVEYGKMMKQNQKPESKKLTKAEEKIAEILKDNPSLVMGAIQVYEQNVQQEELLKQAENYKAYVNEIHSDELYIGNPNGKYVLTEFFDFSCGYCKEMAPRLKTLLENNPDLKIVLKPLAYLSNNSEVAARGAIAASKQGKLLDMYVKIMQEVRPNENTITQIAKDIKLDMQQYEKDVASKETTELLEKIKNTATKIKIKSVPTLVLNGMHLYAVEDVQLQRAIDVLRNSK